MNRRALIGLAGVLLVGCGAGSTLTAGQGSTTSTSTCSAADAVELSGPCNGVVDFAAGVPRTIAEAARAATVGVLGTVVSVSGPQWNSVDGTDWRTRYLASPDRRELAMPRRWREVTVAVERVLFTTPESDALMRDGRVRVWFDGDGTDTGADASAIGPSRSVPSAARLDGQSAEGPSAEGPSAEGPSLRWNAVNGPVAVGDKVLYLLQIKPWPLDTPQAQWPSGFMLVGYWLGNLRQGVDGRFTNLDTNQSWSASELDSTIAVARQSP